MKRLLLMFAVAATAIYVGCKQQDGDRCQVNEDCESDVCNKAKGTCAGGEGSGELDAPVIDAPPDGPPMPDAPMVD